MIYWTYLKYVLRHKYYVAIECFKRGLFWRGITHDMSKFLPSEFIPYARFFYGKYPTNDEIFMDLLSYGFCMSKEYVRKEFDIAWNKHQKRNPHHWQYWLLQNDSEGLTKLDMPNDYLLEMFCDWISAGIVITGKRDVLNWWEANKDKIILSDNTRKRIEDLINEERICHTG